MMNRVLFLYDIDSFTSPPTLPEVGLDGLASEKKYNYSLCNICISSSVLHELFTLIIYQLFKRFLHSLVRTNLEV